MRSEFIAVREMPPVPPPRKTTFVYAAFLAGLAMLLVAGALYTHVFLTKRWLVRIKVEATSRAAIAASPQPARFVGANGDANKCPGERPVLIGFDANGKSVCRALSAACEAGRYVASIDPLTLEVRCADAGGAVSCPAGSYITEFMWLGEERVSFSCHPRLDPFVAWKFTPVLGSRGND
jgi:hypothetical protein